MEKKDENLMQIIGLNVKKERIRAQLSQDDLADMINLNRVSLCNIEAGRQSLTIMGLLKLCNIFSCMISDLVPMDYPVTIGSINKTSRVNRKISDLESQLKRLKQIQHQGTNKL